MRPQDAALAAVWWWGSPAWFRARVGASRDLFRDKGPKARTTHTATLETVAVLRGSLGTGEVLYRTTSVAVDRGAKHMT